MSWLLFKKICFSWNIAALLWPEGEMPPSPPEYSQVVAQLLQQSWAVRGQHLPTGGLYLGREGEKPAGSLLQCLTDDVDSHMHRLGGSSCHASTPISPTGNDVIKDMLLWPRKIWIHRTTRTLDVLNFHCRHRAVTLLCYQSTEEAHKFLAHSFQAESSLKALFQLFEEVPYAEQDCIAQISAGQSSINLCKPPVSTVRSPQTHLIHLLGVETVTSDHC